MTPQRRRRLGRMQLNISILIAAGIALFGLIKYFTGTQENPLTGEKQRVAMSPEQEVALGLQSAPAMVREMGGPLSSNDPRTMFVREVGQKLVAQIGGDHPWKFQFHVIDDKPKMVNAFALPGGQVFITLTLLRQLQNEAQLAGVLGHEIGHVVHRHSAEHMAKGQLSQQLVTAVGVGASGQDGGQFAHMAASVAANMINLKYGRDDELESDQYGVTYMTKAGYDPREMAGVMEILKKASGGGGRPEFTSSHPDPGNRIERIDAIIKQLYPQGVPQNLSKGALLNDGVPGGQKLRTTW